MLVIDRIEGGIVVCETEEGDCLVCVDGSWQIDREETLRRRQQNHSRTTGLFRRKSREQSE